ncbi:hypothetical protein [Paenibacillus sp. UNC499MF]|uniref:hypothetical protein n=1 Tax=Paenibacillus sp. UNC499MF TaxID=1502751 RepID=UPI0011B091D1|nr:hypothetical protein [Paenibacillus sp. UNC499MF]
MSLIRNVFLILIVVSMLLREEIALTMLYVKEETTYFGLNLTNAASWSHVLAFVAIISLIGYLKSRPHP